MFSTSYLVTSTDIIIMLLTDITSVGLYIYQLTILGVFGIKALFFSLLSSLCLSLILSFFFFQLTRISCSRLVS